MSLRLEMLQVSRLAPQLLGESSDLVRDFILSHLHASGGFEDRAGEPDLYYTVFGLESLLALGAEIPVARVEPYLRGFGGGAALDLVHLSCLARCWAALPGVEPAAVDRAAMLDRLATFRRDGEGYIGSEDDSRGNVYGCFMALGTCQDLGVELPDASEVADFVSSMQVPDGGFANDARMSIGTLPVTAAAVTLLRNLGRPVPEETGEWLAAQRHPDGGFLATPGVPMPDLLSTATALHSLAGLQHPLDDLVEPCLDFIDTLWTNRGSFHGHWADDELDCEYTFYGLLALGHLSVWSR